MLEQALRGARLLYAYTMYIEAPVADVFALTGNPDYWTRDFDGEPLPNLALTWEGKPYKPGSVMVLCHLRKDGTTTPVNSVRMELLHYEKDIELSFRFLTGSHLIYRFVYEVVDPRRTEFTFNALVDAQSPPLNTLRQRLYARRRRKASITDHLRVKSELERRAARR
ncbi:MAG: hypothetical protein M3328_09675 [Chloroflexota bacterium]|nr:hypothetical protein [Chloroflexota bacterium]